jgi:hypothetical protein
VYREWLNEICQEADWSVGAAVLSIFIKGTANDPEEVLYPKPAQNHEEIEDLVRKHSLRQHQGLSPAFMDYIRVQHMFAPGSRKTIYDMVTHHTDDMSQQQVISRLEEALNLWSRYQDGIARACGIRQV